MCLIHFFRHNSILVWGCGTLCHVLAYDLPLRSYTVYQNSVSRIEPNSSLSVFIADFIYFPLASRF